MNNNSSLSNCVSPTSNQSTAVSGRTSPSSLMSPQQQQQQLHNGPAANQKQLQLNTSQANAVSDPSNESMSSLKTIAQEVVNRSSVNMVQTPPINMAQQQQQQNQYVMDPSSLDSSSTATGQNGLNANINNLINATNTLSSNTNMKSTGTNEALIPPLLGVAPLGPSPLQKDHQVQVSVAAVFRAVKQGMISTVNTIAIPSFDSMSLMLQKYSTTVLLSVPNDGSCLLSPTISKRF